LQGKCEYQTTTNIAFLCKMVRVPFLLCANLKLVHHQTVPFRYWLPQKSLRYWFGQKKLEDFYIKSLNWKRKRSKSNFQVTCEYQTTTNIAFSCKKVRIPFLLCMILKLVHHQTVPFRYWLHKKSLRSWFGQKNMFWRLLHKEFELEKKTVKFQFAR